MGLRRAGPRPGRGGAPTHRPSAAPQTPGSAGAAAVDRRYPQGQEPTWAAPSALGTMQGHEMIVEPNKVVALELEIADLSGAEVLQSEPERPLVYLHGNGTLAPGLERALEGAAPGAQVEVTLPPHEAFGEVDPARIQYLDRAQFPPGAPLEVGLQFGARDPEGRTVVLWITDVEGDTITVNGNHPLAGHELRFRAKVVAIREATSQEREAGRPLAPGEAGGAQP